MKLTREGLRNYIKRLLIETIYVNPEGTVLDGNEAKEFERENKLKGIPGYSASKDLGLARKAKKDFLNLKSTYSQFVPKLDATLFKGIYSLEQLTFDEEDYDVNPFSDLDRPSFNQGINLVHGLGFSNLADYIESLYQWTYISNNSSKRGASFPYAKSKDAKLTANMKKASLFIFTPPNDNKTGMGLSLIDKIADNILEALLNLKDTTPLQLQKKLSRRFSANIDLALKRNPLFKYSQNDKELIKQKNAYIDSIEYVLGELISEINYEVFYYGDSGEILFIPQLMPMTHAQAFHMINICWSITGNYFMKMLEARKYDLSLITKPKDRRNFENWYGKPIFEKHFNFYLTIYDKLRAGESVIDDLLKDPTGDLSFNFYNNLREGVISASGVLYASGDRDNLDFYNTKYTINPNFSKEIAEQQINYTFKRRLSANLGFALSFRDHGVDTSEVDWGLGWDEA